MDGRQEIDLGIGAITMAELAGISRLQVTKLDAAKRQLETAIKLWFQDGDPVSIHTLAAAAYQVLYDINKKRAGDPMGVDRPNVKPEARKQLRKAFANAENFFKHADADPEATLTFTPEATRFYLLDAADRYRELAGEQPSAFRVFIIYHALTHPEIFKPEFVDRLRQNRMIESLANMPKFDFFALATQAAETLTFC